MWRPFTANAIIRCCLLGMCILQVSTLADHAHVGTCTSAIDLVQTVQPSRYCRDSTDLKTSVPNPAWTLVGTTNVPQSARSKLEGVACETMQHDASNYWTTMGVHGDVSSAQVIASAQYRRYSFLIAYIYTVLSARPRACLAHIATPIESSIIAACHVFCACACWIDESYN